MNYLVTDSEGSAIYTQGQPRGFENYADAESMAQQASTSAPGHTYYIYQQIAASIAAIAPVEVTPVDAPLDTPARKANV